MSATASDFLLALALVSAVYGCTNAALRLTGRTAARALVAVARELRA